eukprot:TRINITY_DN230_c0_g1_i1.p1 TRINITY_DN230_c0_g1~~TRINITY_DN230_c0_g1_i1.p1  ORF type:complete len:181 (+),score=53.91 TRINITY_DN230_c0_g1_i1:66-608(+)
MNTIEQTTFAPVTYTTSPMTAQPMLFPTTTAADPFNAHERSTNYNEQRFLQKQAKREAKRVTKNSRVANKDFAKSEKLYAKAADLSARGKETRAVKKQDKAARLAAAGQVHQTAAAIAQQEVARANSLQAMPGFGRSVGSGFPIFDQGSTFMPTSTFIPASTTTTTVTGSPAAIGTPAFA